MQNQAPHDPAWRFTDLLDIDHIQQLQDAFAEAHHVATVIIDPEGAPITRVSRKALLVDRSRGDAPATPLRGAATLDPHDSWEGAAAIGVGDVQLAEWRISRAPDMDHERFDRVRGFLEQAAELVSHQARMQARLNEALAAQRRTEEARRRFDRHLQLVAQLEAVGRLAGGVAHDIGNLLTAIIAYAEQLSDRLEDPADPDEPAVRILAAADRGADLVHRLLAVARRRSGRTGEVDMVALAVETATLLERTLPRGIRVDVRREGEVRPVEGDGSCLHASLLNLGINAGHAMPRGGELTLSLRERHLVTGPHVEIRVSDTGEGMDEETRRRVFEPFFTTREETGSGLGLTQARSCVERHGGSIEVESEPGGGTTFTILLPVARAARRARREAS